MIYAGLVLFIIGVALVLLFVGLLHAVGVACVVIGLVLVFIGLVLALAHRGGPPGSGL